MHPGPIPLSAAFLRGLHAHALVRDVVSCLAVEGIPVMPMKGVLLARTVYPAPEDRPYDDVDLLVPRAQHSLAVRRLEARGFEARWNADHATTLHSAAYPLLLDLHRAPFPYGLYGLEAAELFARGREDAELFGRSVVVPAPHDLYALLVGHFAKGRLNGANQRHLRDLEQVASFHRLSPAPVARHLARHGLARAARYVLHLAEEVRGDPFAREVRRALPWDPVGRAVHVVAGPALARAERHRWGAALVHAFDRSLPVGARGLAQRAWAVLRDSRAR